MKHTRITIPNKVSGLIALMLFFTIGLSAQLPTANEIAGKMKVGWNMGNTLEAIGGETAWGGAKTTQALIDSVKAAGFNTVRLPVAWFIHSDTITSEIDETWMARVKEVVDYCINDQIYVIINMHWDNGWLENRVNSANQNIVNDRLYAYWTQIAETFIGYDEHLLFAGTNEPNAEDAEAMEVLLTYHQTFIDAVRATGGNNSTRTLIVQGPSTDIDKTNKLMNTLPVDQVKERLMVEVHYYTPYQFCLMQGDANWGNMFYYWGKDYHSSTDTKRNANWGEEAELERLFGLMKTKFVDKGIPVIIGEFGAYKRKLSPPSDQELHNKSVEYFNKYVVKTAIRYGMIPYYWDTNMGLFDRGKCKVLDKGLLDGLMQGAEEASGTSGLVPIRNIDLKLYPNPFHKTIYLDVDPADEVTGIRIFDSSGKLVESVRNSTDESLIALGADLKSDMYLVLVDGKNWIKSFKTIKIGDKN